MAARSRDADSYTGRAGQFAVMANLLAQLCNVAVPEVDVGTDVFAFLDDREEVARIQVKTAVAADRKDGYSAQFAIPLRQMDRPDVPALFYVLATRREATFLDDLIIPRVVMRAYWNGTQSFGSVDSNNNLVLKVNFGPRVTCREVDLTRHRGDWTCLPPLRPMASAVQVPGVQVPPTTGAMPSG